MTANSEQIARGSEFLFLAAVCLLLAGCREGRAAFAEAPIGSGITVQRGQAVWTPPRGSVGLAGDLVLATAREGRTSVQFSKAPMSLVVAQLCPQGWRIEFPMKHVVASRRRGPPPVRFVWLHLAAALRNEPLPDGLRFERQADGNWRLENVKTGESVQGFLSP